MVDAFAGADAAAAFAAVDRVVQTGQDPRRFVDDLLERLRDLIVVSATGQGAAAVLRGVSAEDLARMQRQADAFGTSRLSHIADLVIATLDDMTGATSPRLQLELMVARVLARGAGGCRRPRRPPAAAAPAAAAAAATTPRAAGTGAAAPAADRPAAASARRLPQRVRSAARPGRRRSRLRLPPGPVTLERLQRRLAAGARPSRERQPLVVDARLGRTHARRSTTTC